MTLANPPLPARAALSSLASAVGVFQSRREDVPLNMLMLFLFIAQRGDGIGAAELGRLAGISPASVSRNVQALGPGRKNEPGLRLVAKFIDPINPRAHSIKLTAQGAALASKMSAALQAKGVASSGAGHQIGVGVHWENWVHW